MTTIKVKPWGKDQGEFVLIEESDFDKAVHEVYAEQKQRKAKQSAAVDESDEPQPDAE